MGSCRRPRAPPMGLDPLKALEMLEMPSCWCCSRTCRETGAVMTEACGQR